MSKRLQVVLNQDVRKLGNNGDLVEVAPGYARNYLLPQGIASLATPGILRQVEQRREKERQRLLAELQDAEARKVALKTVGKLIIRKQVGEENQIFGTVTTQDVADAIKERAGQDVDRRGITLPEIGKTGSYEAQVKLHPEVTATVQFDVIPL
ncbi:MULTISPECIES: 50S ribosomal protein L9 [Cyanophyceae]|uniref:Large ribosomal subunit protein bL9 n=1 Tax=Picosynechococcus sp. (strain ATCC 27264 / PCC 7002 / PR-6) TaxID=32049 RepID=RL9_PICP2|nr:MULTISPECIES: 50S ribosomal protein L9 [Cyanophyceae]B1XN09.1 RecName: Full=Large ribosomal subunit protein bL9; AltName: Full=50S ribosomal protein L9 [Picosynechococcus sp. PCC 7002]ACA99489.1 ribosomal protein L9 [Picosynechococcus sp. PCC 7002]AMA09205.1 50S ribosomal protein L9 [Picosynechococcus sp. PCC 73109]ANV87349.1 50S ribosomal protein L9 [Picosynechococcus sp. PCC 7117]ANV90497.1 50S ribosomal protein L9 [Picosynechococcus sp. PCC 8807]QCS50048.1 50S ribosomal protein L9 [Pico